ADAMPGGTRPGVELASRAELQLGAALRALWGRKLAAHGRFIGCGVAVLERVLAIRAHKKHRAGCAFVHRSHRLSARPLRVPRTAHRNDFALLASRARCKREPRGPAGCDQGPFRRMFATSAVFLSDPSVQEAREARGRGALLAGGLSDRLTEVDQAEHPLAV